MSQPWEPANGTEQAMAAAMTDCDTAGYFRALALAELYLPQPRAAASDGPQPLLTAELFGHTFLLVYTSVETMAAQVGDSADAYVVTGLDELSRKWPDPNWRLAVNVGSPIDAYVPVEAVAAAAVGDVAIPNMADAAADAIAQTLAEPDGSLVVDVDAFVEALLQSTVLIPTATEVDNPGEILELDFPWRTVGPAEAPRIEVFTSRYVFETAYPDPPPSVIVSFPVLTGAWPPGHALSLNPGTEDSWDVPGDLVPLLLLWGPDDDGEGDEEGQSP